MQTGIINKLLFLAVASDILKHLARTDTMFSAVASRLMGHHIRKKMSLLCRYLHKNTFFLSVPCINTLFCFTLLAGQTLYLNISELVTNDAP